MRRHGARLALLLTLAAAVPGAGSASELLSVVGTDPRLVGARRAIAEGTHARLLFGQEVTRVALGNERILDVQLLTPRELLVLGKAMGQSSITVWFRGGELEQYVFVVQRDLSILQRALRDIHPNLVAEAAPDRDAVVLRGAVPDVSFSVAAEAAASAYVSAGAARGVAEPILSTTGGGGPATSDSDASAVAPLVRPGGIERSRGRVINLIRVERLPLQLEERIQDALRKVVGADGVKVDRIQRGDVPGSEDAFLLVGSVPNQVTLVRVLTVAGRLLGERAEAIEQEIRVVADESGAIARRAGAGEGDRSGVQGLPGFSGGGSSGFRLRTQDLSNRVRDNIARAKVVELFDGRLVSFLEVEDLPQVRVSVRLYEVNRGRLRQWTPNGELIVGDVRQGDLLPSLGGLRAQGSQAVRIGGDGFDIQNALSLIGGAAANNFQIAGTRYAIDLLFSILSEAGIARSLATPELLVLSGEIATFQVGGEVPVATSVATGAPDVVFDSVFFVPFGVQLGIRPLVGEDDTITLDVTPQVIEPDFVLTAALRESTGDGELTTTAFATRTLTTSARLEDGQTLLVGGLVNRRSTEQYAYTPWLHRIPLLGWLGRSFDKDEDDQELVIVVSPTIVRDPPARVALWQYPDDLELLGSRQAPEPAGAASAPGPAEPVEPVETEDAGRPPEPITAPATPPECTDGVWVEGECLPLK